MKKWSLAIVVLASCELAVGALATEAGPALRAGRADDGAFGERALPPGAYQAARPAGDGALMPAESTAPGWKKAENPRVFTKADLYGYIDGGAELFLEFGFDQLTLQKYRNGANEVAVEIYRMADTAASTGIYLMKCGKETPDASLRERHTINRHQLMFVRNRYWVTVNNLSGGEAMGPVLLKLGAAVAAAMPPHRAPSDMGLPPQGQVPGTLRLVRGPFSLQAIYTLGDGDILQLGGKIVGAAANYKDARGAYTSLVIRYPSPAAARGAFASLQKNLDKYLKPVNPTASRLVFKDYENKFGVATVAGPRLELLLHLDKQP